MSERRALSPARRATLVAAALLTLGVAVLGGWSFLRKIETFQPLGVAYQEAPTYWQIEELGPEVTSLQPADRILTVNGRSPQEVDSLARALRRQAESELLVMRGEELLQVAYLRPGLEIDWAYLVLALIGILYLGIGCYTVLRDARRPGLLFYFWCLTSAALYILTVSPPFDALGRVIFLGDQVARILLAPLTLHLFLSLPSPALLSARLRRAVPFLYLPAAFLLLVQLDFAFFDGGLVFGPPTVAALAALDRIEMLHLVAAALLALGVLVTRLRRRQGWEHRRQLQWVAVGLGAGYLPFVALYVLPMLLQLPRPGLLRVIAVVPLALVPLTFAYAILRYRLWDLEVMVRTAAAYTLTVLLGVVAFTLVNLVITHTLPADQTLVRQTLAFAAGIILAVTLLPTRRTISEALERLHYRDQFRRRRALSHFGQELLHERDLDRLSNSLLTEIEDTLGLTKVNLYLAQRDLFVPAREDAGKTGHLPFDAFSPELWERAHARLQGAVLPAADLTATQHLYADGYRYLFPLVVRGSRVGFLATGTKEDREPLSSDDLDLIRELLNQSALAIENAQLLEQAQLNLEELLQLQEHNRGIIESSPAGIVVYDHEGRIVSANAAFSRIVQIERQELFRRVLAEILPVEPLPAPGAGLLEAKFQDASGRDRYLQLSAASLEQEHDNGLRILVLQDITERVAMENALKEKDRLAALGMLAAGVAHEVNTPLTGISSYAQMLLAETPKSDPRRGILEKIERQTFRASRIVNNLLDFARSRNRTPRPLVLVRVLEETFDLMRERFDECHIRLDWRPPADKIIVRGDEGELQQVFTNLALNSVDAMQHGGGALRVSVESDDTWVRVEVEDEGPGIPPEHLDKVFQPFFSTKLAEGGTGLGLSISYNIVRRHGGTIRVVSEPGRGTCFLIELPRLEPDAEPTS